MSHPRAVDYGLTRFDHIIGNVPVLAPVAAYVAGFTGFHEFAEFMAEDVGTVESGLNLVVLTDNSELVLIPLNEPVHGTKRRSQIQTFLDHHGGPDVQHIAVASDDVLRTLRGMQACSAMGGFEFMAPPPPNYYDGVRRRAGDVLSEELMFFLEIIQRIGCMEKDAGARVPEWRLWWVRQGKLLTAVQIH
ncbi:hypothetical protein PVAP13_7NG055578 [Panicum virgatum]|uniref:4-hydroxyphenylpyruvate dioxygenase n=1 Tax=Panicum virgatum TaxID=38727 RepID=A0A8T0PVI1_PANVG|nr:hypothetical protein PVAP13_7NG055578 [Panicum virgatum]